MGEVRLSYLCTQAASGRITLDEWAELLGYIALDPQVWDLIVVEAVLRDGET